MDLLLGEWFCDTGAYSFSINAGPTDRFTVIFLGENGENDIIRGHVAAIID